MVIGSLFCLSRGLSPLVEGVRMFDGKEGKADRAAVRQSPVGRVPLRRSGGSTPTSAGSGAGVVGFSPEWHVSIVGSSRLVWVSRRAYRRAERRAKVVLTNAILKQVIRSCLTVCLVVRKRSWSWHHLALRW
jgi:hypothetical protein